MVWSWILWEKMSRTERERDKQSSRLATFKVKPYDNPSEEEKAEEEQISGMNGQTGRE